MEFCGRLGRLFFIHGNDSSGHARHYLSGLFGCARRKNIGRIGEDVAESNYQRMQQFISDSSPAPPSGAAPAANPRSSSPSATRKPGVGGCKSSKNSPLRPTAMQLNPSPHDAHNLLRITTSTASFRLSLPPAQQSPSRHWRRSARPSRGVVEHSHAKPDSLGPGPHANRNRR